jgi:hypothetical protein
VWGFRANFQIPTYHARAVVHDSEANPGVPLRRRLESDAVIFYHQRAFPFARKKPDQNVLCTPMLDRVVYSFLSNVEEMGSHWRVMNQNRLVTLKVTIDSE